MGFDRAHLPCAGCVSYKCDVASVDPPDAYFYWILSCYTLTVGGFRIENDQLSLEEWSDLGVMRMLLEAKREQETLSSVSYEMMSMMAELTTKRR